MSAAALKVTAVLALSLLASACNLTQREWHTVNAWLECEDCTDHEGDSVKAIGTRWCRRPVLLRALAGLVRHGPDSSRIENVELQVARAFSLDRRYEQQGHPRPGGWPHPDSVAYVRYYLTNYVSTYRARAAIAIIRMAGATRLPAIDSAADSALWRGVAEYQAHIGGGGPP